MIDFLQYISSVHSLLSRERKLFLFQFLISFLLLLPFNSSLFAQDADNDGISDALECQESISSSNINVGEGQNVTYSSNSSQVVTKKVIIDFTTLDNAIRINVNGISIVMGIGNNNTASNGIMQLQSNINNPGEHSLTFNSNGSANGFSKPWNANIWGSPRLRVVIEEGNITLLGTQSQLSWSLAPVYLTVGSLNHNGINFNGTNADEINIYVPNQGGPDSGVGIITFEYCSDTDDDGIPNNEDTDSDNDGCLDADEKTVSGGIGDSQQATKIEVTSQPQDLTICVGSNATFTAVATVTIASQHNSGTPDYTNNTTTEDVNYQWQESNDNGNTWNDITGASGTANSSATITLNLGTQNNLNNDDNQYRVKLTSNTMVCPTYSDAGTLIINKFPNNVSGGFKGEYICFNEKIAQLSFNANDLTFVQPYTIVYKNTDTGIQYSQVITSASSFNFTPGDMPAAIGTYRYQLVSITNGNGCVRTSGFKKKNAEIRIFEPPTCSITGNNGTVCTDKTLVYTAPEDMDYYNWSISGNGIISGATDTRIVTVVSGNTNGVFTLTLTVNKEMDAFSGKICDSTCSKTVLVSDLERPTFTAPNPFSFCVENIFQASYNNSTVDINPDRPEYYLLNNGDTTLDLDTNTFNDNCCAAASMTISWKIDFAQGSSPSIINGTGQPSTYGSDIQLPGDGVNFTNKTHTITYTLTDCSGNSTSKTTTITVKPRPRIIKQN